jgi:hypothetical protein
MTGDERFDSVAAIGPRSVPALIVQREALAHFQEMGDSLAREAVNRGAKYPPKLQMKDLDLGTPSDPAWTNGTIRYMFPGVTKFNP